MAASGKGGNGPGNGGGSGNSSVLRGGRGDDTFYIDSTGVSVSEKPDSGIDTVFASVSYWLDPNVENLTLVGTADLYGSGNDLDNSIYGNSGSNTLAGLTGNDVLFGEAGDDILIGGEGSDQIDGGEGDDTVQFSGYLADYSFLIEDGFIYVTSVAGDTDRLSSVEVLSFADHTLLVLELPPSEQPPTDAPVAVGDYGTVTKGGEITLAVLTNDLGEGLRIAAATNGVFGVVVINDDGTISYTPGEGASEQDSFSYTIIDDNGRTATTDVILQILDGNVAPIAVHDAFNAETGIHFESTFSLLDNDTDSDGDTLSVTGFDATSTHGGTVVVNSDGTFSYSAASGFSGTDSFGYSIDDGLGGTSSATVTVEVAGSQTAETPYYVTGLIRGDTYRFNPDDPVGTAVTVTYAFAEVTPDYYYSESFAWTDFEAFSDEMRGITREALSQISEFADITFVETAVEDAGIVFGIADVPGSARGLAYYPNAYTESAPSGDVWIDSSLAGLSFEPGTLEYKTLVHEIGHSLGLMHADLPLGEETRQYTVMSDAEHPTFDGEPSSMLLYDVAALQYLYGANDTATAGDDTYTFDMLSDTLTAIWDAGGHDRLDLSDATYGVRIDLQSASFSTVSASGFNNIALAHGTVIEDAIGSAYDDQLDGNDADNYIFGGDGNDMIFGGEGSDVFGFGGASGADRISDFSNGVDKLSFSGPEASISDLQIVLEEYGILIHHSGGSIQLDGVEDLAEEDFMFGVA